MAVVQESRTGDRSFLSKHSNMVFKLTNGYFVDKQKVVGKSSSSVCKGYHSSSKELPIAAKQIVLETASYAKEKFERTIKKWLIFHNNIVSVLDHFVVTRESKKETFWIISEYCDNLLQLIKRDSWDSKQMTNIMTDCAAAISFLHSQDPPLCHRNIHPRNILVKEHMGRFVAKVDGCLMYEAFGDNKESCPASTPSGQIFKECFKPPEAVQTGGSPADNKPYDVFCLGAVFHATLSHKQSVEPDKFKNASSLLPYLPESLHMTEIGERNRHRLADYIQDCEENGKEVTLFDSANIDPTTQRLQSLVTEMLLYKSSKRKSATQVLKELKIIDTSQNDKEHEKHNFEDTVDYICNKFLQLLVKGPMKQTDDEMIAEFLNLTQPEMKCVMKECSIENFLLKYRSNSLELRGSCLFYKDVTPSATTQEGSDVDKSDQESDNLDSSGSDDPIDPEKKRRHEAYLSVYRQIKKNKVLAGNIASVFSDELTDDIYVALNEEDKHDAVEHIMKDFVEWEQITLHKFTPLEADTLGKKTIPPCFGPGTVIAPDPDLINFKAFQHDDQTIGKTFFKTKTKDEVSSQSSQCYGTVGCIAKDENDDMFVLTVKHIINTDEDFDEVLSKGNQDMIGGVKGKILLSHKVLPADVTSEFEDCIHVCKKYEGYLGTYEGQTKTVVDIALLGPFTQQILSTHDTMVKDKIQVYDGDREDLNQKPVQKRGATTGLTRGIIINPSHPHRLRVNKGNLIEGDVFLVVPSKGQKAASPGEFANYGDSGALVFVKDKKEQKAVGLIHSKCSDYELPNKTYKDVHLCVYLKDCLDLLNKDGRKLDLYYDFLTPNLGLKPRNATNI